MNDLKTVLVVDDSKVSRMMCCGLLRSRLPGVAIIEAANTVEARQQIEQHQPDWLVIDHNMPGETGLDLAESIRAQLPAYRIALLTANIQETTRDRAASAGVDFFAKPINGAVIDSLIACMSSARVGSLP